MYNQVVDVHNSPQVTQITIQQKIYTIEQAEQAIRHLKIPDQVDFKHMFEYDDPCIYGVHKEKSVIYIDGIGRLEMGYERKVCCMQELFDFCCGKCYCVCECFQCNEHDFPLPKYWIENENIRMEYWNGGIGKIMAGGQTVIDFTQCYPNICDLAHSHCQSAYPQLRLQRTQDLVVKPFLLTPEPSPLPEECCNCFCPISLLGLGKTSRNFYVDNLTQGRCVIINRRNCVEACAKITQTHGIGGLPRVDYPKYSVQFENVQTIDKVAILMGLVHHTLYKKWFRLQQIKVELKDYVTVK